MKVTIIGTGYVGLTTGLALDHVGHAVACVDINERVVERLRAGEPTIFENCLQELLATVRDRIDIRTIILALKDAASSSSAAPTTSKPQSYGPLKNAASTPPSTSPAT